MLLNMTSFLAAFFLLVIVLLSITSIYAGLLKTLVIDQDSGNLTKPCDTCFCVLGERLLHATEDALCMKHLNCAPNYKSHKSCRYCPTGIS